MSFNGSFSQTGGTWDIGINSASNNGVLAFSGSVTLPDLLNVSLNHGCVLGLSNSFAIVDYTSPSALGGSLSATNLPADGASWQLNFGSTALTLLVTNLAVPTVSISSPANNAYLVAPSSISISADARTPTPPSLSSSSINISIFWAGSGPPYNFTWNSVSPGFYTLTALASDANGAVATSAPVNITVVSSGPQPTNYTWTGAASSDWFAAGNCSPSRVPGALDNVTLAMAAWPPWARTPA